MFRNGLEVSVLGALAATASALWLVVEAGGVIAGGKAGSLDVAILMAFRSSAEPGQPAGRRWVMEIMRDVSGLGSPEVLCMLVGITVIFLFLAGRRRTSLFLALSTLGGAIASVLLKAAFGRARPDLAPYATYVYTTSFPSGHAMLSAVVYLILGFMVARLTPDRWLKIYVLGVAAALFIVIGVSRLYLGSHWPSDVLGGWAAGAAWAFGSALVAGVCELEGGATR